MIGVRFRTNFRELEAWLGMLATRQVPFATAKALTRTAQDARDAVRAELPKRFTIRSGWVAGGIRIVPASKNDWPRAVAWVGSRDPFMELQETGGVKTPAKGARNLAIPTPTTTARRTGSGRIPASRKPRALLDKPGVYVAGKAIRRRKRRRSADGPETLYLLRPRATLKPRFGFQDTVEKTVAKVYAARFREAFEAAIVAPRKPGRLV